MEEPEFSDLKPTGGGSAHNNLNKYSTASKMDWSDNETISDLVEPQNSRHLSSPKRKINKTNHYSVSSSFRPISYERSEEQDMAKSLPSIRSSSSKTSLINR